MFQESDNKLKATFKFKDFSEAIGFMIQVAIASEKKNHHPWWSNVYDTVNIELTTHDAGNKVTQKDHDLAQEIEAIYGRVQAGFSEK